MKLSIRISLILVLSIAFTAQSCAPSYQSFKNQGHFLLADGASDSLKIRCSYRPFDNKGNFAKKASKDKIAAFFLEVTNTSDKDIKISPNSFFLESASDRILPLNPDLLAKQYRSKSGLYMFWSLFWIAYTNQNGTIPIPIGVIIGVGQMSKANNHNKNMRKDLKEQNYEYITLAPGETQTGHVYFGPLTDNAWTLKFDYMMSGEEKKAGLSIDREAISIIRNDWKKYRVRS